MNIKKNIAALHYTREDISHTIYGSLIESILSCCHEEVEDGAYIKVLKKCHFPFMDDPNFIEGVWNEFFIQAQKCGLKDKQGGSVSLVIGPYDEGVIGLPLCVAESPIGALIVPYSMENEELTLYPCNRDFSYPFTVTYALANDTWRIIDWGESTLFLEDVQKITRKTLEEKQESL